MAKVNEFLYILFTNYSYKEMNAGKESRQIARLKDVLRYVAKNYRANSIKGGGRHSLTQSIISAVCSKNAWELHFLSMSIR